jgi:citrate lyase subunit alpha/citrate CoA-transferase
MNKLVSSIEQVIDACELKDGMCVSFHHHLRNGDYVTALVLNAIDKKGLKNIKVSHTSIMNGMAKDGIVSLVKKGVITEIDTNGVNSMIGELVATGVFPTIAKYRTHGGRPKAIESGEIKIDVAFIAAPTADPMGNLNGVDGPSACGSLGYPMSDARYAKKVVVVTDNLVPYPLNRVSIDETLVDYVVKVERIGDPSGIATGVVKTTKDPVALILAKYAAQVIQHSGLFKDGFSFQAGASGPAIATTQNVHKMMIEQKIHGSFIQGGITGYAVDMLDAGLFDTMLDVQSFDTKAAASMKRNPLHREISASCYANPNAKSCGVNSLDAVILGALQVDVNFDVNVHVDSTGIFTGGSGGHGDTSYGSKLSVIVAPLTRTRFPTIVPKVSCRSTPGKDINVVVTQYGVAVNPVFGELRDRLKAGGVKLIDIEELQRMAEKMVGIPKPLRHGDRVVAEIIHRDGTILDRICNLCI